MTTHTHVIELLNVKPKPTPRNATPMVHVYNNVYVEREVYDLWLLDAKKWKYTTLVLKLTKDSIKLWKKPELSWQDIDPYSSLEDVGPSSDEKETPVRSKNQTVTTASTPDNKL